MNKYLYDGPVMVFETCVERHWKSSTYAVSEKKARSNLAFQYKQRNNLVPNSNITLPGKITIGS